MSFNPSTANSGANYFDEWRVSNSCRSTATNYVTNGSFTGNANSWTLGGAWHYNSNAVDKDTDGTSTLAQTTSPATVSGHTYIVNYTISNWTAGSVTAAFGGANGTARSADGIFSERITATGTGTLIFTPSNDARFTIDNISVMESSQVFNPATDGKNFAVDGNTVQYVKFNEGAGNISYDETANNLDVQAMQGDNFDWSMGV